MSGELVEKLRHRAMVFLREAKRFLEEGEYDLACLVLNKPYNYI